MAAAHPVVMSENPITEAGITDDPTIVDPDEFPEFQDALYDAEHDDSGAPETVPDDGKTAEGGAE